MKKFFVVISAIFLLIGIVSADQAILFSNYDAYITENTDQGVTIFRDVGDAVTLPTTINRLGYTAATTNFANPYNLHSRGMISYSPNSTILSTATINSATVYIFAYTKSNTLGIPNLSILDYHGSDPAVAGDYDSTYYMRQSTDVPYDSFILSSWIAIPLTNITGISKTGNTTYLFTHSIDTDSGNFTNWTSGANSIFTTRPLAYSSGTYASYIIVDYTPAVSPSPLASFDIVLTDTSTNNPTSWQWNLTSLLGNNTEFIYGNTQNIVMNLPPGNYRVKFTATSPAGSNSTTRNIGINLTSPNIYFWKRSS